MDYEEFAHLDIQINGETICTAFADRNNSASLDPGPTSCSATTYAAEGKESVQYLLLQYYLLIFPLIIFDFMVHVGDIVQVVYRSGTDTTPVYASTFWYYTGFTGFRI